MFSSQSMDSIPRIANDMMREKGLRHLAVSENGKIVGVISARDLLKYFKIYYGDLGVTTLTK